MESDSSSQSSMESITSSEAIKQQSSTSSRRFSVAQTATLNRAGMKGESKGAMPLLQSCSRETGLTTVQVKVSVTLHVASLLKDPV